MQKLKTLMALGLAASLPLLGACGEDDPVDETDTGIVDDTGDTQEDGTDGDTDDYTDSGDTSDGDADDGEDGSGGGDGVWPSFDRTEAAAGVDARAWNPSDAVPAGEARLGELVTSKDSPFGGPEARCREGDYVLANQHIYVCIAGLFAPNQYTYTGGYMVDIAPADELDADYLEGVVPAMELRIVAADAITPLSDGQHGESAVLQVEGRVRTPAVLGNFMGDFMRGPNAYYETEYRLAPDARTLEVITWIRGYDESFTRAMIVPGDLVLAGDHMVAWVPGEGALDNPNALEAPVWMAVSPHHAYGIFAESLVISSIAAGLLESDITPLNMGRDVLEPDAEAAFQRFYGVASSTLELEELFGIRNSAGDGEVTLTNPPDERYPEQRVLISKADGFPYSVVWIGEDGESNFRLPAGDYSATWWGLEDGPVTTFTVPASAPIAMAVPERGLVKVWIDAEGAPSPARVRVIGSSVTEAFAVRGEITIPMAPGTYRVEVSRGEEFSLELFEDVVVNSGETAEVVSNLARIFDTTGWVVGDFHQHQRRSIDSDMENPTRIATNLGTGLEVLALTDHDSIEDIPAIVETMGVGDMLFIFQGTEVSPTFGHLNAFPMPHRPHLDRMGAVPLSILHDNDIQTLTAPELVAAARNLGAQVIQINHPRDKNLAYFSSARYDPVLGPDHVSNKYWPGDFDTMEIVNSTNHVCQIMQDWFSLMRRGIFVTGMGNSDSHGFSDASGWPRNYLFTGTDDVADLDEDMIIDALLNHRVSVSGGIFVSFGNGVVPGDFVDHHEGTVMVRVRIQTPEWAGVDQLVAFVNGIEQWRYDFDGAETDDDHIWLDADLTVQVDEDAFIVFYAYANSRWSAVTPGKQIFGFANPLFVDFDGDGEWTPPGVDSEADVPIPTGLNFCQD